MFSSMKTVPTVLFTISIIRWSLELYKGPGKALFSCYLICYGENFEWDRQQVRSCNSPACGTCGSVTPPHMECKTIFKADSIGETVQYGASHGCPSRAAPGHAAVDPPSAEAALVTICISFKYIHRDDLPQLHIHTS
jgi:hypothetical protein